jgi:hypothetical protein
MAGMLQKRIFSGKNKSFFKKIVLVRVLNLAKRLSSNKTLSAARGYFLKTSFKIQLYVNQQ